MPATRECPALARLPACGQLPGSPGAWGLRVQVPRSPCSVPEPSQQTSLTFGQVEACFFFFFPVSLKKKICIKSYRYQLVSLGLR